MGFREFIYLPALHSKSIDSTLVPPPFLITIITQFSLNFVSQVPKLLFQGGTLDATTFHKFNILQYVHLFISPSMVSHLPISYKAFQSRNLGSIFHICTSLTSHIPSVTFFFPPYFVAQLSLWNPSFPFCRGFASSVCTTHFMISGGWGGVIMLPNSQVFSWIGSWYSC